MTSSLSKILSDSARKTIDIFLFDIELVSGQRLLLTSGSREIKITKKNYKPHSGLELIELYRADSGDDSAIIQGIYEENGISKTMNLSNARIDISILEDTPYQICAFFCTKFESFDLNFKLHLESFVSKYDARALLKFSKTCRAKLGDEKCKIDLSRYSCDTYIQEINENTILVSEIDKEDEYFSGGTIAIYLPNSERFTAPIISHRNNLFVLSSKICSSASNNAAVTLYPNCDKKLTTCCNRFDNVLNFRGEPYIPEIKKLRN